MNAIETLAEAAIRPRAKRMPVARATVVASLLLLAAGAARCADGSAADWGAADDAYAIQHYAKALHGYEAMARSGDAAAAERAGQMLYFGHALYGKLLPQDLLRAKGWLKQAASADRQSAGYLLVRLARQRRAANPAPSGAGGETPYTIGEFGC